MNTQTCTSLGKAVAIFIGMAIVFATLPSFPGIQLGRNASPLLRRGKE
jgi:hypothetical protein